DELNRHLMNQHVLAEGTEALRPRPLVDSRQRSEIGIPATDHHKHIEVVRACRLSVEKNCCRSADGVLVDDAVRAHLFEHPKNVRERRHGAHALYLYVPVTLTISETVVTPCRTFSMAASRSVRMPSVRAASRSWSD